MAGLSETLQALLARGEPAVLVRVARSAGSAPREAGCAMLVTAAEVAGTVGGGRLEWLAIERAREMLAGGERQAELDLPLGPAVGQCCGGHVLLSLAQADEHAAATLARAEAAAQAARPAVQLYGAGHVGQALARALAPLPLALTVIDDRRAFLDRLPAGPQRCLSAEPASEVALAPHGAAFVVMTHSHALDYAVTAAALERGDACYVGLIGSATKRARFARWFRSRGGREPALARLTCPIGGTGPRDKRPEVIAALVAAEIVCHALDGAAADHGARPATAARGARS